MTPNRRQTAHKLLLTLCGATMLFFGPGNVSVFALLPADSGCPTGMSNLDCNALVQGYAGWIPTKFGCPMNTSTTSPNAAESTDTTYYSATPVGTDNPLKIYNFFVGTVGLSPAATAGIMGNIQEESGFDPTSQQASDAWQDMSSVYQKGVGLVQWDGGRRPAYITYAKAHNADPKDIVPQLNYIWHELNNGYKTSTLDRLTADTKPDDAAFDFHKYYEISADNRSAIQERLNDAIAILAKYGSTLIVNKDTGICNSTSTTPTCTKDGSPVIGLAQIICAAEKYDTTSYSESFIGGHQGAAEWHKECNNTYKGQTPPAHDDKGNAIGEKCYTDCSGLVNMAVYDVYGVELRENTDIERADSTLTSANVFGNIQKGNGKYWRVISYDEAQAGDIMQPILGHVVVVDHKVGNTLYTFAAHTSRWAQPLQVGPSTYHRSSGQVYFRYIGPGSTTTGGTATPGL